MTRNQIELRKAKETERSNVASHNEMARHNRRTESAASKQAEASLRQADEAKRSNLVREAEQRRANMAKEDLTRRGQDFSFINPFVHGAAAGLANDPEFYNAYPDLVDAVGKISLNGRLALQNPDSRISVISGTGIEDRISSTTDMHTGIYMMTAAPVFGKTVASDLANNALNKAARVLFAKIQAKTSYNKDYSQADLMLYLGAIDSAYTTWAHLTRIYLASKMRSPKNDFLGDQLVEALGMDAESVRKNYPNFRTQLELAAVDLKKFFIPSTLNIFRRHQQCFSQLYKDSHLNYDLAQIYAVRPYCYYLFKLDAEGAGMLEAVPYPAEGMTVDDAINILTRQLDAIQSNGYQDFAMISGDIESVFGDQRLVIADIKDDSVTTLLESFEVGTQFANARTVPVFNIAAGYPTVDLESFNLKQDPATDSLLQTLHFTCDTPSHLAAYEGQIPLNVDVDKLAPIDSILATRFSVSYDITASQNDIDIYVRSCGSVLPMWFTMYISSSEGVNSFRLHTSYSVDATLSQLVLPAATAGRDFAYRPVTYVFTADGAAIDNQVITPMNGHKWTYISKNTLDGLHDVALRSLYYVAT